MLWEPMFSSSKRSSDSAAARMLHRGAEAGQEAQGAAGLMRSSATEMENFESYCISLGVGPLWYS